MTPLAQRDLPTYHRVWKEGTPWAAQTYYNLPNHHRLNFYTYKNWQSCLVTVCSVVTWTEHEYGEVTHFKGPGEDADLCVQLAKTRTRATEKAVTQQHNAAIDQHFDSMLAQCIAKYGDKLNDAHP